VRRKRASMDAATQAITIRCVRRGDMIAEGVRGKDGNRASAS